MHTPRFSGHPISAGDLVLAIIPSRPILTNCENVGTVVPHSRAKFRVLLASARLKAREDTNMKGLRRIRINNQQETPYTSQKGKGYSGVARRGLLGFSGLAS